MKIRLVLFDLGNVVIKIDFNLCYQFWSKKSGVPLREIQERFVFDQAYSQFEKGEIQAEDYHLHIQKTFAIPMSYADFAAGWNSIFEGPIAQTTSFLSESSDRLKFAAFTNTNELHRQCWSQLYAPTLKSFHKIYCSSQIKHRKPERAGFEWILRDLHLSPDQLIFVDDLLENVRAAESIGIKSVHFTEPSRGIQDLRNLLKM